MAGLQHYQDLDRDLCALVGNARPHLRNHGFLLDASGWRLAPAYDLNPSTDKDHLALNIDDGNSDLDLDLARSVGEYFHLDGSGQERIIEEVKRACRQWRTIAEELRIPRPEQEIMAGAFRLSQ